jgi:hypothetical protein
LEHEREHFGSQHSSTIFADSDDCGVRHAVRDLLAPKGIEVVHLPCTLKPPVLYSQRGRFMNVTGHNQNSWNDGHTCTEVVRYFAGLEVFRDADVFLLGSEGVRGVSLHGHGSKTVLLILNLREWSLVLSPGRYGAFVMMTTLGRMYRFRSTLICAFCCGATMCLGRMGGIYRPPLMISFLQGEGRAVGFKWPHRICS